MDDTWESNVSPLMMGVGMSDIRGMGDMQPSCSGQDMPQDINPQNITNHHQHSNDMNQDLSSDMQDLDQDLSHNIHHHQPTLNHNNYYNSHQVSLIIDFAWNKNYK